MTKYQSFSTRSATPKKKEIHPIWRGVGFVLMILTPVLAYAATIVLMDANRVKGWVRIPRELIMQGWGDPYLLVKLIMIVLFSIVIYGLFSFITFIIYGAFGAPRYGPYDVPQKQFSGKQNRR